jgi:hypothetical protein
MRSFMTHPAMAAAAMLVLIVGVAGTVYMRKGDHFAKQTADDSTRHAQFAPTPSTEPQPSAAPELAKASGVADGEFGNAGSAASRDDYRVGLDDEALKQAEDKVVGIDSDRRPTDSPTTLEAKKNKKGDTLAFETSERRGQAKLSKEDAAQLDGTGQASREPVVAKSPVAKSPVAKTTAKPAKPARRLEVSTPSQGPKDFESTATKRGFDDAKKPADSVAAGAGTSSGRTPVADPKPGNAAPASPPPAARVAEKEKQEKPDPIITWAKERHGKVIAAVRAGKCENAASIAVDISNRAPAYYASNVENDRTIKPCMQYITAQREKEAERVQRAKSTQRRAADEAPAPTRSK